MNNLVPWCKQWLIVVDTCHGLQLQILSTFCLEDFQWFSNLNFERSMY
jgi:hypothetical protein